MSSEPLDRSLEINPRYEPGSLANLLQVRDPPTWREFEPRFRRSSLKTLRCVGFDRPTAEDVSQQAFTILIKHLDRGKYEPERASVLTYGLGIVRGIVRWWKENPEIAASQLMAVGENFWEQFDAKVCASLNEEEPVAAGAEAVEAAAVSGDLGDLGRALAAAVDVAIRELKPEQREMVAAWVNGNSKYETIGQSLGVSGEAVHNALQNARKLVRKHVGAVEPRLAAALKARLINAALTEALRS